jgi:kynurenine formamidase
MHKLFNWPNASGFEWRPEHWGPREDGHWYAAGDYAASEHGGTHLDAPVHFSQGGHAVDEVPVSQLVAPAVVIDISKQCGENRDYLLQPRDVENCEKVHGLIPKGCEEDGIESRATRRKSIFRSRSRNGCMTVHTF